MDIICSNNLYINDLRNINKFKKTLFSGYEKKKVLSMLDKKLLEGKIESSCYLSYELLVSGYLKLLWDKIQNIIYKNIKNPSLIKWIYYKNKDIERLINKYKKTIIHLRNSQYVRNIITEALLLICQSTKKEKIELLKYKPKKDKDFEINKFYSLLKHKNNYIIKDITGPNDKKEVCYVVNEIAHNLLNKNIQLSMYWIEWLIEWEKQNIKKFKKFEIQSRDIKGIPTIYQTNLIWIIWCVILYIKNMSISKLNAFYGDKNYNKLMETLDYIWMLYLYEWKPSLRNKKQILIYLYINYLLNPQDLTIQLTESIKYIIKYSLLIQEKLFIKIKNQSQHNISSSNNNYLYI